jgi:hypothetical protein
MHWIKRRVYNIVLTVSVFLWRNYLICTVLLSIKGTVSRDFRPSVFFHQSHLGQFFAYGCEFPEIFAHICDFELCFSVFYELIIASPSLTDFTLKGPWHEIFDLCFFHQTTSPGSLIHRDFPWVPDTLCLFEYGFEFAKIIDKVGCTARSMTPLCMSQHCQWHRCVCHSIVNDTAVQPTFFQMFFIRKSDSAAH